MYWNIIYLFKRDNGHSSLNIPNKTHYRPKKNQYQNINDEKLNHKNTYAIYSFFLKKALLATKTELLNNDL